jgi:hypothetical protein
MDTDKSGSLSVKEFRTGLRVMGINLAPSMATKVAHRFDADGTNSIDYLEMFALLASHELPPRDRRQLRLEERRRIEAERDASGLKPLGLDLDTHTEDGSDSDGNQSAQSAMKVVQGTRRIVRVAPETLASLGLPTHIEPRRSKVANKSTAPPIEDSLPALNGIEEQDGKAVLHAVMPSTATPPEKEAYLSDLFTRKFQKSRVKELHSFTVNDLKGLTKIELASLLVARDYPYEDIEPIFGNHQVLEQIGAALGRLQFSFRWELFVRFLCRSSLTLYERSTHWRNSNNLCMRNWPQEMRQQLTMSRIRMLSSSTCHPIFRVQSVNVLSLNDLGRWRKMQWSHQIVCVC